MFALHEKILEEKLKDKSPQWFMEQEGYGERIDFIKRKSLLASNPNRKWSDYDVVTLGQQFRMHENMVSFLETNGGSSELGPVPTIGLDVIAGIYGNSITAFVGGTQNLKDESGNIYFKNVSAGTTRGNVTQDQLIRDARRAANVYQQGYAAEKQVDQVVSSTSAGITTYNLALPQAPIKKGTLEINIPGMNIEAIDNRKSGIIGTNIQGTVNYDLGTVTLQLLTTPAGANSILATWSTDFEKEANSQPIIKTGYDRVNVTAEILLLRGQTSIYKDFAAEARFGQSARQDMVNTLINELTAEINYRISNDILRDAVGETKFDPNQGDGVSFTAHAQEFMARWAAANVQLRRNAGRGLIQTILAGDYVCQMFDSMPRFEPSNITADGCHIYGTIDGKIIIRCPHYDPLVAVGVYRGESQFNTGYMYAPYMPLYVDGSLNSPDNPVVKEGIVTVWSAFKTLIPTYFTKFRLTNIPGANYV